MFYIKSWQNFAEFFLLSKAIVRKITSSDIAEQILQWPSFNLQSDSRAPFCNYGKLAKPVILAA